MRSTTLASSWPVVVLVACVTTSEAPTAGPAGQPTTPDSVSVPPEPEPAPAPAAAIPRDALAVMPLHEGRVLVSTAAELEWAAMPITSVEQIDYHMTWTFETDVDVAALPGQLRVSLAEPFDLYGVAGKLCTVTLDQLAIEAYVLPDDDEDELDLGQLRQLVEHPGEDDLVQLLLVGGFATDPRCQGALWARAARLPPPLILVPAAIDDEATTRIATERARVLDSDDGQELARQYRAHLEQAPSAMPWSTYSEGNGQIWADDRGRAQLIVVGFGAGMSVPCFSVPQYVAVRPIDEEGPPPYSLWGPPTPSAVFDADLDGRYELLFLQPWGALVHIELVSETTRVDLRIPENSSYNC